MPPPLRTNVYVDAFNLYFGGLIHSPHKWLNIRTLCEHLLDPSLNSIHRIRVFAAPVDASHGDPDQPTRQQTYFRALQTVPGLTIHLGNFLTTTKRMKLVTPLADGTTSVDVWKTEEKGSDVNLASHLLCDGYERDYEAVVLISNDSDLQTPLEMARSRFGVKVILLHPQKYANERLVPHCDFVKRIRRNHFAACQFAPTLTDEAGTFSKPPSW